MTHRRQHHALPLVEAALRRGLRASRRARARYLVPSLWTSLSGEPRLVNVNPYAYYLKVIESIRRRRIPRRGRPTGGEWTNNAVVYNMFLRSAAAVDHDANGRLDLRANASGFRETGTFLKGIAMLPYIKRLGANTVHLLPITAIGHDGNKGTLGSPYAIRNPYELDENLSEPALGLDAKTEFKAFVEAAHRLGLRVVVEFVFRTAAKDADWVKEHPEWFYWIGENVEVREPHSTDPSRYGSPLFTREELETIHRDVREHRFDRLLPPHRQYRDFFTEPPATVRKEQGRYIGTLPDGRRVKIPGAFADWPPDDSQPPWGDVTYLKMYDHADFNYIGYNTIRMYDTRLTRPENVSRALWKKIVGIIPYYQKQFHIDGVMIDMGHALPMDLKAEMVATARANDADFAFWDENFSVTKKSREEGYNAVFGFCWADQHHREKIRGLLHKHASEGFPIPYFATPENHNTPRAAMRAGGGTYARWAMVINAFLPAIPFIHSGYELTEDYPINTGLDFTREQLRALPSEKLPLFSEYAFTWTRPGTFVKLVRQVLGIRRRHAALVTRHEPSSILVLQDPNPEIVAFARVGAAHARRVAVVTNASYAHPQNASVHLDHVRTAVVDLLSGERFHVADGVLKATLAPGRCIVVEY